MIRILYMDRESSTQMCILRGLTFHGFQVDMVTNMHEVKRIATDHTYDCTLARCSLRKPMGVPAFCSHLRASSKVVIILVEVVDTLLEGHLFDCGVDDVIISECAVPELIVKRIKARLRRFDRRRLPAAQVTLGEVVIDFSHRVVMKEGVEHQLPGLLTDLLYYFVDNAERIVSRQELHESAIWADSVCTRPEEGGKTFDMHVSRLRRLIEENPGRPRLIESVRGVGWKLAVRPIWHHCGVVSSSGIS